MTVLYSLALLVSAALLFLLEPMVGKFVLPLLGSSPEVWPTTVLFFQAVLLAGYAFAHVTSRLPARRQAVVQLGVIVAAAAVLPIGVPDSAPPASANPIPWLVALLATTAGLPFFALAALGPMLQRWLAGTRHRAARDPYFLFAASNGGSLLGLLAYPLVLEPQLSLGGQGTAWSIVYALAFALVLASAALLWLQPARHASPAPAAPAPAPAPAEVEPSRVTAGGPSVPLPGIGYRLLPARARTRFLAAGLRRNCCRHAGAGRAGRGGGRVGRGGRRVDQRSDQGVSRGVSRRSTDSTCPCARARSSVCSARTGRGRPRR